MKSIFKALSDSRKLHRAIRDLQRCSDNELRDLGISRGGIRSAVRFGRGHGMPDDGAKHP